MDYRDEIARRERLIELVDEILTRHGLRGCFTLQRFLQCVAADLRLDLQTFKTAMPAEIGGLGLADRKGRAIILVNQHRDMLAEDQTILHELGHLVLGHLDEERVPGEEDESDADFFAQIVMERMVHGARRRSSVRERLRRFFWS